jgi:hypothetical protein
MSTLSVPTLALSPLSDSGVSSSDGFTNIKQIIVTGTGDPGVTIHLKDLQYELGTTVVKQDGTWEIQTSLGHDGENHGLYAYVLDGDESVQSDWLGVTYYASAATPVRPGIQATPVETDKPYLTHDTELTFVGQLRYGEVVTLYDGATVIGSYNADNGPDWAITAHDLNDGMHVLTTTVTDLAGNVSAHSPAQLVDIRAHLDAPAVQLDAASDTGDLGDSVTRLPTPTFTGATADLSSIELIVDDVLTPHVVSIKDGVWSIRPLQDLSDGNHGIEIIVHDTYGNSASSGKVFIGIDAEAPPTPVQLTPESDGGELDGGVHLIQGQAPAFTGVTEPFAVVELSIQADGVPNRVLVDKVTADNFGRWTISSAELNDGNYKVFVHATDWAGNASADTVMDIRIASGAPALSAASDSGYGGDQLTNIAKPTIHGSTAPNASVILYEGITVLGSAVADQNGNWSISTTNKLSDGLHTIIALASDSDGHPLPQTGTLFLTIDTGNTTAPAAPVLDAASDSGLSSSDLLTNVTHPTVHGSAVAGSVATLFVDGKATNVKATANDDGNWSLTSGALTDGVHKLTVSIANPAGTVSPQSAPLTVAIDSKAPPAPAAPVLDALSDSGLSNADRITNDTTPQINGKAEAGATVTLFDGGIKVGSALASASGAWSISTSTLADGKHQLTAVATDAAGNDSPASAALSVTIRTNASNLPPTGLDLAAASDKGAWSNDNVTNANVLTINGKADAGATVLLYDAGLQVGKAVANATGVWTVITSKLADGAHHLTAAGLDAAGNTSAPSAELVVTVDTSAPAAASSLHLEQADDSGVSNTDGLINTSFPHFYGTAQAGSYVQVFDNGVAANAPTKVNADGTFGVTAVFSGVEGVHNVTVKVSDLAGNVSASSQTVTVTADFHSPVMAAPDLLAASDTGASNSDNYTSSNKPTLTGKTESNIAVSLYEGDTLLGSTVSDQNGNWQITPGDALADGAHSLTVRGSDRAGNTSAASPALTITIDTAGAGAAPSTLDLSTASDKGASPTDDLTNLAAPTITGKATAGATVVLLDGATKVGTAVANASGVWTIASSKLADGVHHLTASSLDQAGNLSTASDALDVSIDTAAPVLVGAPLLDALSDSGSANNDRITKVTAPTVSGSTEAGASVALYDGATLVGSAVADGDGVWSITSKALAAGAHSLTVKLTDLAGNISAASPALALTVDTAGPAAPATLDLLASADSGASASDNVTSVNTPVVSGKAEANASVALYDGATLIGTAIADSKGAWQIAASTPLADGVHSLTAKATDAAGNVSPASTALSVTIDTTAPSDAPAALDLAAASDKGASSADDLTNLATPTITGKAAVGATVVLFDGAAKVGTAIASAGGVWSIASGKLTDGVHHLTASTVDAAGNVSAASAELLVTVDSVAPAAVAPLLDALSDSGRSGSDRITNVTTPKVGGTTEAGASVALFDGATQVGTAVADADGAWSITSKALATGAHNLTIKVTDIAGNLSAASPALALTIDNKAPAAPTMLDLLAAYDSGASATDNLTAISAPVLTGKAEANAIVSLYEGATLLGSGLADSSGNWKIASTLPLSSGVHNLTASAADIAGNTSAASAALKLTIDAAVTGLTMTGTAAIDSFVLNQQAGAIKVVNFSSAGGDQLLLSHAFNGLMLDSAADVLAHSQVVGKDTVIDLGAGHAVTLVGITTLSAHDIVLIG